MAVSLIGYPLPADYCPGCGSSKNFEQRDQWQQDGLLTCKCGCRCYIIEAEEAEA